MTKPTEDAPEFSDRDSEFMQTAAGAEALKRVHQSYIDAGFNDSQAMMLLMHVMELGMKSQVMKEMEEIRVKNRGKGLFSLFNLKTDETPKEEDGDGSVINL
jgi:hypothetical protein